MTNNPLKHNLPLQEHKWEKRRRENYLISRWNLPWLQYCVMLLEKCIMGYYSILLWPATVLLLLYKAFIFPPFLYCSTIWHFCDSRNNEMLNKRVLRVILNDKVWSYGDQLQWIGDCLFSNKQIQSLLIIIFKCLYLKQYPQYRIAFSEICWLFDERCW